MHLYTADFSEQGLVIRAVDIAALATITGGGGAGDHHVVTIPADWRQLD